MLQRIFDLRAFGNDILPCVYDIRDFVSVFDRLDWRSVILQSVLEVIFTTYCPCAQGNPRPHGELSRHGQGSLPYLC